MLKKEIETFYATSQLEWRQWLAKNHQSKPSIWLVQYKAKSGRPTISWKEAVDEALCYGWIDSTRKSIDDQSFRQFFCKRKPHSAWSKINKENVARLIDQGKMTKAGFDSIEIAKQNRSWNILDEVEELTLPAPLQKAFNAYDGAEDFFMGLSRSVRKSMLQWLALAKRTETLEKRCQEIATLAAQKLKPKQF